MRHVFFEHRTLSDKELRRCEECEVCEKRFDARSWTPGRSFSRVLAARAGLRVQSTPREALYPAPVRNAFGERAPEVLHHGWKRHLCGPGENDELAARHRTGSLSQDVYQGLGCATRADTSSIAAGVRFVRGRGEKGSLRASSSARNSWERTRRSLWSWRRSRPRRSDVCLP